MCSVHGIAGWLICPQSIQCSQQCGFFLILTVAVIDGQEFSGWLWQRGQNYGLAGCTRRYDCNTLKKYENYANHQRRPKITRQIFCKRGHDCYLVVSIAHIMTFVLLASGDGTLILLNSNFLINGRRPFKEKPFPIRQKSLPLNSQRLKRIKNPGCNTYTVACVSPYLYTQMISCTDNLGLDIALSGRRTLWSVLTGPCGQK